jgi:cytochrome c peroxidase
MSTAKVALGRRLFFETRLSTSGRYSCASCHRPEIAFTDGRAHAQGATGESVRRSAMSLANVAYNPAFTWGSDKVRSLEAQMCQPLFNEHPVEMGVKKDGATVVKALSGDANYRTQFAAAFPGQPEPLSMRHIIESIASFERTLISGRSPFDRYVFDDDQTALSSPAKRGMVLFYSARIGCAQCHSGINFTGADMGKFKVPTLRNVALTAPYMHDGSLPNLEAVLDHYVRGGHKNPLRDPRVRLFRLSQTERQDLLEFLKSLTDREFVENAMPVITMRRRTAALDGALARP